MSIRKIVVDGRSGGMRLDIFLSSDATGAPRNAGLSRAIVQKMIAHGQVTVNGKIAKSSARLKSGDVIAIQSLSPKEVSLVAESIHLDILHEDGDCIVLNKPPGMVVHPAAGVRSGTLVNALLYRCPKLEGIGGEKRPGIVHRLDKDTSGVMVVAKRPYSFQQLAQQFKERRVRKQYLAVVWGHMGRDRGVIDRAIGRHRTDRKKMSSVRSGPKVRSAVTEWNVEASYYWKAESAANSWVTLLRLKPQTGRTHQIRVHLADVGHPIVGDKVYGKKRRGTVKEAPIIPGVSDFPRQALHAEKLEFVHPRTGATVEFCAPLHEDMERLIDGLEKITESKT